MRNTRNGALRALLSLCVAVGCLAATPAKAFAEGSTIALNDEYMLGDTINLNGKVICLNDKSTTSKYGIQGSRTLSYNTDYNYKNGQHSFKLNVPGDYWAFYVTDSYPDTPIGVKVTSGDGTSANPFRFTALHNHVHTWTYSASGNQITATCGGFGDCEYGETQTLTLGTASGKTYDGTTVAVPSYTVTDGWTAASLPMPSVSCDPENSAEPGTYTASVTVGAATAQVSWTIEKIAIAPTVAIDVWTYGGAASVPSVVAGNPGDGSVTYQYKAKGAPDETYSDSVPSDAGDYTVRANVAETQHHKAGIATADFVIAPQGVTLTATSGTLAYNRTAQTVSGFAPSVAGLQFEGVSASGTGTDAGEYAVTFGEGALGTLDTTGNYVVAELVAGKLTITPVSEKVTVTITGHTGTFDADGTEHVVSGYDFAADNPLYLEADASFSGTAEARRTDVVEGDDDDGTTEMGLVASQFANANDNFENVEFVVTDGWCCVQPGRTPNRKHTRPWIPTGA